MSDPTTVHLFSETPELLACVPAEERHVAERVGRVHALRIPAGPWEPPQDEDGVLAQLVTDGALVCTVQIAGRASARVLGRGDVFDPRRGRGGLVGAEQSWRALQPTTVAALDSRFVRMAQRWPHLIVFLQQRLCDEATRSVVLQAIGHLPRVELRLLGLLWHLGERFGTADDGGMAVPLKLTHAQLGRLVGAQRPTVSIALQALRDSGDLDRRADGTWWLADGSRAKLAA